MPVAAVRPFVDGETIDLTASESASPPRLTATALHKKVNSVNLGLFLVSSGHSRYCYTISLRYHMVSS